MHPKKSVKNLFWNLQRISFNFPTENCGYIAANCYVLKNKELTVLHSPHYTNMEVTEPPWTKKTMQGYSGMQEKKCLSKETNSCTKNKDKKTEDKELSNVDVTVFLFKQNICREYEFMQVALWLSVNDKKDL